MWEIGGCSNAQEFRTEHFHAALSAVSGSTAPPASVVLRGLALGPASMRGFSQRAVIQSVDPEGTSLGKFSQSVVREVWQCCVHSELFSGARSPTCVKIAAATTPRGLPLVVDSVSLNRT